MLWGEALLPGLLQLAQAFHSLVAGHTPHFWCSAGRRTPSLVPAHCQAAVVVRVPKETLACPALGLHERSGGEMVPAQGIRTICGTNEYDSLGLFWGMLLKHLSLGGLL